MIGLVFKSWAFWRVSLASHPSTIKGTEKQDGVQLKRNMTVLGGISLVVGTMIGSGIFVSPTGIISMSGSIGSALVIWVICGFIATISSLCYIELGLLVEESGAEYSYCNSAFGQLIGFLIGWTNIILCKPARYQSHLDINLYSMSLVCQLLSLHSLNIPQHHFIPVVMPPNYWKSFLLLLPCSLFQSSMVFLSRWVLFHRESWSLWFTFDLVNLF